MRIEIVRVVKAELDETEFETMMVALAHAGTHHSDRVRREASAMETALRDALTPPKADMYLD